MRTVGVTNENVYADERCRPETLDADASSVTENRVAFGNPPSPSGVKIRIDVPDQWKVPRAAGAIENQVGASVGRAPTATIGSENVMRTSLASIASASSPVGSALTTDSAGV